MLLSNRLMWIDAPRIITCGLALLAGCLSSPAQPEVPGHTPGTPGIGSHALSFYRYEASSPPSIETAPMTTQPSGSTIIVSVGRGDASAFALPADNKGNTPQQLGAMHTYTKWPTSGTGIYAFTGATGGANHTIRTTTPPSDEITLSAVEVIEGAQIQAYAWSEVASAPLTSNSVTTTGPATLIAFWWGDAFAMVDQTVRANNGFTVVDSVLASGSLVQSAVAVKNVAAAGTYDVTWTVTPAQGAQLWLIAVQ
jgi:hypothetical protein